MSMDFSPGYCTHCNNTGYIDCHCGGDLCICENNGEEPCPYCDRAQGDFYCDDVEEGFDAGEWTDSELAKEPQSR